MIYLAYTLILLGFTSFSFAKERTEEIFEILEGKTKTGISHKCGNQLISELRNSNLSEKDKIRLNKLAARPERTYSYFPENSHFRIHYDTQGFHAVSSADTNSNQISDYVEQVHQVFEEVYSYEIDFSGYEKPPTDLGIGGGNEFDVYIEEFSGNVYGITTNDPNASQISFITIDNNFLDTYATKGLNGLKVTAAHEFFHAIQFGIVGATVLDYESPFAEESAVWAEDQVYDEINDYYNYLNLFFENPGSSLLAKNSYVFGASVWCHFLAERFGNDLIKKIWLQTTSITRTYQAAENILKNDYNSSFKDAYSEFVGWTYFTGNRSILGKYFSEAQNYPETAFNKKFDWTGITKETQIDSLLKPISYNIFQVKRNPNSKLFYSLIEPDNAGKLSSVAVGFSLGEESNKILDLANELKTISFSETEVAFAIIGTSFTNEITYIFNLKNELSSEDKISVLHNSLLD
ncbi:hypothetical protein IT568_04910, partial [bacterium]|nr:hypothetical protein [bacterium]